MHHNINELCNKIDVIKQKADKLRLVEYTDCSSPEIQYTIADVQALCADIANDQEKNNKEK